ncbi:hypothetical protein BS47DRAFT_1378947 [Hydnum rufescens UP504]|uniref:Uncharacterized protein n=1 Tax=Hydnum rufescens UP504 TaxID=1448309 RepID=A0A9P6BAT0_9AGAM|nr:hypothetical protein BS47DRAFT_1378947 [Hydnum rufescens UP504]
MKLWQPGIKVIPLKKGTVQLTGAWSLPALSGCLCPVQVTESAPMIFGLIPMVAGHFTDWGADFYQEVQSLGHICVHWKEMSRYQAVSLWDPCRGSGDGAKLEGTILKSQYSGEERGQLKDCELAPGVATQPDVSLKASV